MLGYFSNILPFRFSGILFTSSEVLPWFYKMISPKISFFQMLWILPQSMDMRCRDGWMSRSGRPAASLWFYPRTGMQPCGCVIITAEQPQSARRTSSTQYRVTVQRVSTELCLTPASRGIRQFGNKKISVKLSYICANQFIQSSHRLTHSSGPLSQKRKLLRFSLLL